MLPLQQHLTYYKRGPLAIDCFFFCKKRSWPGGPCCLHNSWFYYSVVLSPAYLLLAIVAVYCIVDKRTTALPLDSAYDAMVRFPENPNTEDLSGLALFQVLHCLAFFACISGGISALFLCKVPNT